MAMISHISNRPRVTQTLSPQNRVVSPDFPRNCGEFSSWVTQGDITPYIHSTNGVGYKTGYKRRYWLLIQEVVTRVTQRQFPSPTVPA